MGEGRRALRLVDLRMTGIGGLVGSGWLLSALTASDGPARALSVLAQLGWLLLPLLD